MTRHRSLWTDRPDDWLDAPDEAPTEQQPTTPRPPQPPRASSRVRRRVAAAGATVALSGVLFGAYSLGTESANDTPSAAQVAPLPATGGKIEATKTTRIYASASKGVVSIRVTTSSGSASGTGFVLDKTGTIVTNAHVVEDVKTAQIRFDDNGPAITGKVIGVDPSSDLAVIKVDPDKADLRPLPLADSSDVRVGDAAIAIGYPLGLDRTATQGIISGLGRKIEAPNGFSIDEVLQTDAPINPGNSGGPLLDARGRVVGVNSQIATSGAGGGSVGIGFAVPSNTVREVVPTLKAGKTIERAWLGVSTGDTTGGTSGAQVGSVTPGSPASDAGVQTGDIITEVDGKAVHNPDDVSQIVSSKHVGDRVDLKVKRGSGDKDLEATLAKRPATVSP